MAARLFKGAQGRSAKLIDGLASRAGHFDLTGAVNRLPGKKAAARSTAQRLHLDPARAASVRFATGPFHFRQAPRRA